jgi:2-keto-4-pentenoate hydratase/2-oxohepta-3-ene-1,7-dioic acid hydratase in catechol pathway
VIPDLPIIFTKAPSTVTGPDARVTVPSGLSAEVDYEAELAVVIGKPGKDIPTDEALEHVWGYTLLNDLTARDLQRDHKQWFLGKSPDDFAPMGPWAVTKDEVALDNTLITCTVNGELRQKANTADLIFDVPTLIATLSAVLTLQPGDIIATGTPAGVGIGFDPPRFLTDGDLVEVTATGLGTLRTRMHFAS